MVMKSSDWDASGNKVGYYLPAIRDPTYLEKGVARDRERGADSIILHAHLESEDCNDRCKDVTHG